MPMTNNGNAALAKETVQAKNQRREAELALAMKEEVERRAAVVKNMHRLRALRLSQASKASASIPGDKARHLSKQSS
jgi:hypothetical protein